MNIRTCLIAALLAVSALTAQAAERIRFATEGAWAPFNYVDESGELKGMEIDLVNALCSKLGAECEIVALDWDGLIPGLMARKYDAIIAGMSITKERQRVLDFTQPYVTNSLTFIGPKGVELKTDKEGLRGKTIGSLRASIGAFYLEDNLADVVNIKLYDSQDKAYLDLAGGRLDAIISDKLPAYDWLQSEAGQGFEFKGEDFARDDKWGIAVRKGDKLRHKLDQALQQLMEDGTYAEITSKYFPFPIN